MAFKEVPGPMSEVRAKEVFVCQYILAIGLSEEP